MGIASSPNFPDSHLNTHVLDQGATRVLPGVAIVCSKL